MLTSYTSSEEENMRYLRKFAQNIKNNNDGPKIFENTADYTHVSSTLPPPLRLVPISP